VGLRKVKLDDDIVGLDNTEKIAFVLRKASKKTIARLREQGYRIIVLDSEFTAW
jgi:sensor c-di-GMP phosphodiesterase-like protein